MQKILLIIKREYLSRVRKKSFLILTFLVPVLFVGMYAAIFLIYKNTDGQIQHFTVIDESGVFKNQLKDHQTLKFNDSDLDYQQAKNEAIKNKDVFLLYIPKNFETNGNMEVISEKKANLKNISEIEYQLQNILYNKRLLEAGIDTALIHSPKDIINLNTKQLTESGEQDASLSATYAVGFLSSFLIYMALFIYGAQVMRGVIEEKTNRIIEVVISSVKPFQLMLGKIIGIGAVGLTQFMLWIALTGSISAFTSHELTKPQTIAETEQSIPQQHENPTQSFVKAAQTINFSYILSCFVFYFIGGYLLYSALFAAVGSAVDNETETQQFMLPITIPLIFTFILGMNVIVNQPDSNLSFWLSVIPFTSPIAMMIRIPFGVPAWELALSMIVLVIGFVLTTWAASRIYRVGILMYGKKASYKELLKWFMYKS